MQFASMADELSAEIAALNFGTDRLASVALFFGGDPVFGSRGVEADFAGQALDEFQDLVQKHFASSVHGSLGSRGIVPSKDASKLMVTNVARGSFGFVLEEAAAYEPTATTALHQTVDDVAKLVARLGSAIESEFEDAINDLSPRVLGAAQKFFSTLEKASASIRIVEDEFEAVLGQADVHRAYIRTSEIVVDERSTETFVGRLYLLPLEKRFNFYIVGSADVLSGRIDADLSKIIGDNEQQGFDSPAGKYWRAEFSVREVKRGQRDPKLYYTLLRLMEEVHVGVERQRNPAEDQGSQR